MDQEISKTRTESHAISDHYRNTRHRQLRYLSIKKWDHFQHYKDRRPPWIKLHAELLDNYDFLCLQDASKAHLMLLWVLASKMDNRIPHDLVFLSKKLGCTQPIDIEELVLQGFIEVGQDDGKTLARRKQGAMPETEAYEEETETEKKPRRSSAGADLKGLALCSKSDCDAQFQAWGESFGAIDYPTFRKKLLTTYQPGQPVFTLPERVAAIEAAHEWWIEQDDRDQGFFGLDKFLQQLGGKWVRFGRMPRNDANGLTERGEWAGSRAMREAARKPRLAS